VSSDTIILFSSRSWQNLKKINSLWKARVKIKKEYEWIIEPNLGKELLLEYFVMYNFAIIIYNLGRFNSSRSTSWCHFHLFSTAFIGGERGWSEFEFFVLGRLTTMIQPWKKKGKKLFYWIIYCWKKKCFLKVLFWFLLILFFNSPFNGLLSDWDQAIFYMVYDKYIVLKYCSLLLNSMVFWNFWFFIKSADFVRYQW
jgi:hypothetical protein